MQQEDSGKIKILKKLKIRRYNIGLDCGEGKLEKDK